MHRLMTIALIVGATTSVAARDAKLSRECRREIIGLCGLTGGRSGIRACLAERKSAVSPACQEALIAVASARAAARVQLPEGAREMPYGADPRQRLDLWRAAGTRPAPVVVFIHGGGWAIGDKWLSAAIKATHFTGLGYAFASLNYRLVPGVGPADQARDIARALATLRTQPGVDGDRIFLIGHSAGAHLAALVGTDTHYLREAAVPVDAVRGIVLLDGAGYDVAAQMRTPENRATGMYRAAFGDDPARQAQLSPTTHVGAPDVGNWLIVNDAARPDSDRQSALLAAALASAGTRVARLPVSDTSHRDLNRNVGIAGDAETARIDAFIAAALN